jgi:hypothetical protein
MENRLIMPQDYKIQRSAVYFSSKKIKQKMKTIVICRLSLMALFLSSCKESVKLDESKLDTTYFIGEYRTNYREELETITLKENGWYDYAHGKNNDTIIKYAGKWNFNKEYLYVYINDFPNIRERKVYEEEKGKVFDMMLSIENVSDLGDLYTKNHEESRCTFVKLDKSKNKRYLLKTEK